MTWLARIELDNATLVRCALYDSYRWHQAAWQCFPGRPRERRDFLTRLDTLPEGRRLYILGETEPQRPSWCPASGWASKPIADSFLEHERYCFDVVVNPTRCARVCTPSGERKKNGQRQALLKEEEQLAWLARKGEQHGFILDTHRHVVIDPMEKSIFTRKGHEGTHLGFRFRGLLQVTDRERFQEAFRHGLGSAKAFGFGMLLIQPIA